MKALPASRSRNFGDFVSFTIYFNLQLEARLLCREYQPSPRWKSLHFTVSCDVPSDKSSKAESMNFFRLLRVSFLGCNGENCRARCCTRLRPRKAVVIRVTRCAIIPSCSTSAPPSSIVVQFSPNRVLGFVVVQETAKMMSFRWKSDRNQAKPPVHNFQDLVLHTSNCSHCSQSTGAESRYA